MAKNNLQLYVGHWKDKESKLQKALGRAFDKLIKPTKKLETFRDFNGDRVNENPLWMSEGEKNM